MKIFLIVAFAIIILVSSFCIWVLAKISSRANDMEEQMEIERKLRNGKK